MESINKAYFSVSQGNQGIGIPLGYGNATLAGSKSLENYDTLPSAGLPGIHITLLRGLHKRHNKFAIR